jgi:hypothetical protein
MRPQSRFDMHKAGPAIKRGQRTGHHRRGVALGHKAIWLLLHNCSVDSLDASSRQLGQCLIGLHQLQVQIGGEREVFRNLIEHLSVLAGEANDGLDLVVCDACLDDRSHLDGLGTRPKYKHWSK